MIRYARYRVRSKDGMLARRAAFPRKWIRIAFRVTAIVTVSPEALPKGMIRSVLDMLPTYTVAGLLSVRRPFANAVYAVDGKR
jgi:hypothetical protein